VYGFLQHQSAIRLANGLPQFANGGEGDFGTGTPVMLHGRERIIPLDKPGAGGGVVVHAPINISASGGPGAAAQAGREAADALIARLRQAGVKL